MKIRSKQDSPELDMLLCNACGRLMPSTLVELRIVDGSEVHVCLNWGDCRNHWPEGDVNGG